MAADEPDDAGRDAFWMANAPEPIAMDTAIAATMPAASNFRFTILDTEILLIIYTTRSPRNRARVEKTYVSLRLK